jgi:hypothetical protein
MIADGAEIRAVGRSVPSVRRHLLNRTFRRHMPGGSHDDGFVR